MQLKNSKEWEKALQRVIKMQLDSLKINIDRSTGKQLDFALNSAIYTLKYFRDKEAMKTEYLLRLQQMSEKNSQDGWLWRANTRKKKFYISEKTKTAANTCGSCPTLV